MRHDDLSECHRALAFWGKTPHGEATGSTAKPALHHLIDVAAAALRLQEFSPSRLARDAAVIGVSVERLLAASAWLAGLHDLGKYSVSFQAKVEVLWPAAILGAFPGRKFDRGHWRNTAIILLSVANGSLPLPCRRSGPFRHQVAKMRPPMEMIALAASRVSPFVGQVAVIGAAGDRRWRGDGAQG